MLDKNMTKTNDNQNQRKKIVLSNYNAHNTFKQFKNQKKKKSPVDQSTKSNSNSDSDSNTDVIAEMTIDRSYCRFHEQMGIGTFKRVYKGYDLNNGREIAWSIAKNELDFEKVIEEIRVMQRIDHPNIIKYISGWYDQDKKEVVIITELLPGGSILKHLKFITTSPILRVIKTWIREILEGLNYLHTKMNPPVIHCDIKCDNIFINRIDGKVKIGDLGGCEVLYNDYATHYVGTEEFMAPEVFEGRYTTKADIYSLGMCIIEMITLELPYRECKGAMNIYDNIQKGIYPKALSKIKNEKLVEVIKMCLSKEDERPTAAMLLKNEFINDLDSEENDHPIQFKNIKDIDIANEDGKASNIKMKCNSFENLSSITLKKLNDVAPIFTKNGLNSSLFEKSYFHKSKVNMFDVSIYENTEHPKGKKDILNLTFIVEKREWKKAKQIDFEFYLKKDTIEEVVNELTKCINLTKKESDIVLKKLSAFFDENGKKKDIKNEKYDFFIASYQRIKTKLIKLQNSQEAKNLMLLSKILDKKGYKGTKTELLSNISKFKSKIKKLDKVVSNFSS